MNIVTLFFLTIGVLLLSSCSISTTTLHASSSLAPTLGVNIDPTNTQGGNASVSQLLSLGLGDGGGGWLRIEFKDNGQGADFNPSTWNLYDAVLKDYVNTGFKILLIVDYQTAQQVPWKQSNSAWANYAGVFAAKVATIVSRYSLIPADSFAIEVWNEPDLTQTNVPEVAYANLLYQTYQAVKVKARSGAMVVMGGLASGNPGYVATVRSASPNGRLACDAIALHPYGQRPTNDWPSPTWGFGTVGQLLQNYKNVESSIPYIISEVGTADTTVQGEFPSKFFAAVQGKVKMTVWFCFSDGMVNPFGLLDKNGNKKQSWFSYQQYVNGTSFK